MKGARILVGPSMRNSMTKTFHALTLAGKLVAASYQLLPGDLAGTGDSDSREEAQTDAPVNSPHDVPPCFQRHDVFDRIDNPLPSAASRVAVERCGVVVVAREVFSNFLKETYVYEE